MEKQTDFQTEQNSKSGIIELTGEGDRNTKKLRDRARESSFQTPTQRD